MLDRHVNANVGYAPRFVDGEQGEQTHNIKEGRFASPWP